MPEHLMQLGIPHHLDLRIGEQTLLQDLLGAERSSPVHQRDVARDIGKIDRLFDRGVAAADHDHLLAAEEEAVAGGASRYAVTLEALFGGKPEPARLRARRDDERIGGVDGAAIARERKWTPFQIGFENMVAQDFGADMFGLHAHLVHEPRALDHVGETWIVLDIGRGGHLPPRLDALDEEGLQHGARGVDAGGVAGGA